MNTRRMLAVTAAAAVSLVLSTSPAGAQTTPNTTPTPTALFDASFGHLGRVDDLLPALNYGTNVTAQPDGKLLFSGTKVSSSTDFAVGRLNPNGSLDTSFGSGGIAVLDGGTTALGAGRSRAAVQPDGKIVLAQTTTVSGSQPEKWVVGRMLPNGAPDTTFSGDGRLTLQIPGQYLYAPIAGLMVGADGTIVIAGSRNGELVAARLLPDGSLDRHYGSEGRVVVPLPGQHSFVRQALLDSDGNLVVAGDAVVPGSDSIGDMLVMRLLPNGAVDPSFGFQGSAIIDSGVGEDRAETFAVDDAGRILVAGTFGRQGSDVWPIGVVRLLPNGTLDPSFGIGGRQPLDTGRVSDHQHPNGIAQLPDGRVVVAGEYLPSYGSGEEYVISKFVAVLGDNGTKDPTFDGEDGVVFFQQGYQVGGSALVTPDGKVVLHSTFSAIKLHTSVDAAAVSLSLTPSQSPAMPGVLTVTATVRNDGPLATDASLSLRSSKPFLIRGKGVLRSCTISGDGTTVSCSLGTIAVGRSVTLTFPITVTGDEGSIDLEGQVNSSVADLNPGDNTQYLQVLTEPGAEM